MKTMGIIDQYGYTMEHMGRAAVEAAEYRERGEWVEAHKAQQLVEKYREQANALRKRIKESFFLNAEIAADPAEATIHQISAKAREAA